MLQGTGATSPSAKMEGDMNRYDCEVQKNGISAVVFYVLSSDTEGVFVDDLIDPEGNSWRRALRNYEDESNGWDSSGAMRKRWYSGCGVITFLKPAPGIWQLKAHTASGDRSQFSVYMAQIGGIDLEISFKQNERFADDGTIYVRAKYQGQYMSADFYDGVTAMCDIMPALEMPPLQMMPEDQIASASQTGAQSDSVVPPGPPPLGGPIQLTYDPDSNAMTAEYRASFPGNYMVNARLNASQVDYVSSGTISFTPRPSEDIVIRGVGKSVKVVPELTDSWKDIPLTVQSWTVKPRGLISVKQDKRNEQSLTVEGLENGTGTLEIIVTGTVTELPTQPQWTISYPVTVGR